MSKMLLGESVAILVVLGEPGPKQILVEHGVISHPDRG
jgi:hypothetical protein